MDELDLSLATYNRKVAYQKAMEMARSGDSPAVELLDLLIYAHELSRKENAIRAILDLSRMRTRKPKSAKRQVVLYTLTSKSTRRKIILDNAPSHLDRIIDHFGGSLTHYEYQFENTAVHSFHRSRSGKIGQVVKVLEVTES